MAIAFFAPANWTATTSPRTVVATFATGDEVIVFGAIEGGGAGISLATPTGTGLTFSLVTSNTGAGECASYLWRAVAASAGTGVTISSVKAGAGAAGICAWVRPGTAASRITLTANLTEAGYSQAVAAGDDVIVAHADFLASAATKTISTGSGTATERVDVQASSTTYSIWGGDWQGTAAGTFTFGITSYTGTQVAKVGIVLKPPASTNAAATQASAVGTAQNASVKISANAAQAPAAETGNNDASPSPMFGDAGAYLTGATTSTANFPVPPGTAAGQLVVISMYLESLTTITTIPTGFTLEYRASTGPSSGSPDHDLLIFWKWCTGTDAGTYDFVLAGNFWREGVAVRYSNGVGSGSPFDNYTSAVTSSSTGGVTPAVSMNTGSSNDLLIFVGTNFNQGAWTQPSGWNERVDAGTNLTVDDLYQLVAGATGSVSATCSGGATTSIGFLGSLKSSRSVVAGSNAPAEVASAAGSGQGATSKVNATAGVASAVGTAPTPLAGIAPPAAQATASGAAQNAAGAPSVVGAAGVAQGVGTGQGATTKGTTTPTAASASGAAQSATVLTAVVAPAGAASATGTAQAPTDAVSAPAAQATASGAAQGATAVTGTMVAAGVASAAGTSPSATTTSSGNATSGVASAVGSAAGAATTSSGNATAGVAAASGTAQTPRSAVGSGASSAVAAGAGTAPNPTTSSSGNATPGAAVAAGSAPAPTVGIGGGAGLSAGSGTAPNASVKATGNATPGVAQAVGTAYNASAGSNTSANAGVASASGTAQDTAGRFIVAQAATASGSAVGAVGAVKPVASPAGAAGTATGPVAAVGALPGPAAATGVASNASTTSSNGAQAGVASAAGTVPSSNPAVRSNPTTGTSLGTAGNASAVNGVQAQAGVAGGSGTAYQVATSSARLALAGAASAAGVAFMPTIFVVAPGQAFAGVASARGAAYGAVRRPIFVGGLNVLLQIQTLTVITPSPGGLDSFGNQTWDYGVTATRRDIAGWIQQDQRSEGFIAGRDPLEEHWLLMTSDVALTGRDRVYWGTCPTGPTTFEVEGPPEPAFRPGTGFHHTEATMRILTG